MNMSATVKSPEYALLDKPYGDNYYTEEERAYVRRSSDYT